MPFRLFQYSLPTDSDLSDLNAFLAGQRVATVQRELVATTAGPLLMFIVEYVGSVKAAEDKSAESSRVDYREVLGEHRFTLFNTLRDIRKKLAEKEGVPVYAIFSNAQLAAMIQQRCSSAAKMQRIDGVGKARTDKYAEAFLPALQAVDVAPDVAEESPR
jgi:superfamily II DNA helicase RecQ